MTKTSRLAASIVNAVSRSTTGRQRSPRTDAPASEEIEFLRWRAERWMKLRHLPAVPRHDPGFVLTHMHRMLAHTFRGTSWKSVLGIESARTVFRRYRTIRERERNYLDWPDPVVKEDSGARILQHQPVAAQS